MPPSVVVRDLLKRYGPIEAVAGASFEVEAGEIFGLIGPNGAGKTTTVECLIGLREPDSGEIEIRGLDARRRRREVKQRIGAALQTTALQDTITPREAVRLFAAFYGRAAAPAGLIQRFGLQDKADARFETLSGGQRQRLALALAFVNEPEVVFLDEPTAGLDPQSRRELHGDIFRMKEGGRTVLLTTHYLEEAERLCDRIAVIHGGRIIAAGAPRDLSASSAAAPSVTFLTRCPIDPSVLARVEDVRDLRLEGTKVSFQTTDATRTLAALTRALEATGAELTELHVRKSTLEDLFLELTADLPPEAGRQDHGDGSRGRRR
jgi:ABC-2 type transport system ATP-binding protein